MVTAKFLQGAHGPVKSLLNAVYYYQDSLGSTSHIASSTGTLLEYYKYDLYGKPTYWDAGGNSISGSNPTYNVRDLFSGERWISEMSMYDLRNRFYSPDLGRFLQPDPIGFKGDASNLYRYCGNDWANRADPMGLLPVEVDAGTEVFVQLAVAQTVATARTESLSPWQNIIRAGARSEHATSVLQKNGSTEKKVSATRTDGKLDRVRQVTPPSGWQSLVDVHSHGIEGGGWDTSTGSRLSHVDVAQGILSGRTQVVVYSDRGQQVQERYRPADPAKNPTWQQRERAGGVIEQNKGGGGWNQFGANPRPDTLTHETLENMASQGSSELHSGTGAHSVEGNPGDVGGMPAIGFMGVQLGVNRPSPLP